MELFLRSPAALRQLGVRGFKKAVVALVKTDKKPSGRDPYTLLKSAITSLPDEEKVKKLSAEKDKGEERRARRATQSRLAMLDVRAAWLTGRATCRAAMTQILTAAPAPRSQEKRQNLHLSRLIKLRLAATEALPDGLKAAARLQDTSPFPVQRRVFTETAPIPDYKKKLRERRE